jgi:AcrR family transcriptional regulator
MSPKGSRGSSAKGGAGEPRYLDPDVRRRQLVNAAAVVFAARGFPATRISDIAAEAGVAQGTVYRFFESKEEIASAIFEFGQAECRVELERLIAEPVPPLTVVHSYIAWYARYLARRRPVVVALFSWQLDPAGLPNENAGNREWIADALSGLLADAGVAAAPDGVDLGKAVPLIVYSLTALSHLFEDANGKHTEDVLAAALVEIINRILGVS